jgi:hypothetical protein
VQRSGSWYSPSAAPQDLHRRGGAESGSAGGPWRGHPLVCPPPSRRPHPGQALTHLLFSRPSGSTQAAYRAATGQPASTQTQTQSSCLRLSAEGSQYALFSRLQPRPPGPPPGEAAPCEALLICGQKPKIRLGIAMRAIVPTTAPTSLLRLWLPLSPLKRQGAAQLFRAAARPHTRFRPRDRWDSLSYGPPQRPSHGSDPAIQEAGTRVPVIRPAGVPVPQVSRAYRSATKERSGCERVRFGVPSRGTHEGNFWRRAQAPRERLEVLLADLRAAASGIRPAGVPREGL